MSEQVECHAGYRYPQRPRAFEWGGQRLEVAEVQTQARTPEGFYFQVRAVDGRIFELRYREHQDTWLIAERGGAPSS